MEPAVAQSDLIKAADLATMLDARTNSALDAVLAMTASSDEQIDPRG
jgi:hypothetical protein